MTVKVSSFLALALFAFGCASGPARQADFRPARRVATGEPRLTPIAAELATWQEAVDACKRQGTRLPTARDYVDILQAQGITVLEHDEVIGDPPKGYYVVDSRNEDGALDAFFMNHEGYQRSPALKKFHLLWTASTPPGHPEYAHVFYDEWGGGGGDPRDHKKTVRNSYQCVDPAAW